jgi:hypothetical protein
MTGVWRRNHTKDIFSGCHQGRLRIQSQQFVNRRLRQRIGRPGQPPKKQES